MKVLIVKLGMFLLLLLPVFFPLRLLLIQKSSANLDFSTAAAVTAGEAVQHHDDEVNDEKLLSE